MSESASASAPTETADRPELKRVMGPGLLLLFVVGDILGTGVYALTGKVAGEVGGAVWLPFLCAFIVALLTATSYLELVTKYPKAGGAAVYTHKAFGIHFLTFLLTFAVMCSGLTSASSASKAFAANFFSALKIDPDRGSVLMITSLAFMALIAIVNLRGVGESVKANVVLTLIELTGLLIVIGVGAWALAGGDGDTSRLTQFNTPEGDSAFGAVTAATALAFFAMVGFEDSVNMAEETKDPVKIFPKSSSPICFRVGGRLEEDRVERRDHRQVEHVQPHHRYVAGVVVFVEGPRRGQDEISAGHRDRVAVHEGVHAVPVEDEPQRRGGVPVRGCRLVRLQVLHGRPQGRRDERCAVQAGVRHRQDPPVAAAVDRHQITGPAAKFGQVVRAPAVRNGPHPRCRGEQPAQLPQRLQMIVGQVVVERVERGLG